MDFSGHMALITGAGQGIGRACAEVFAANGADLALFDKNSKVAPGNSCMLAEFFLKGPFIAV